MKIYLTYGKRGKIGPVKNFRQALGTVWLMGLLLFLTSCGGLQEARADLKTRVNWLGWGKHEMILAVPGEFSGGAVFDRLPDFSLITGVKVQDYRTKDWQGIEVTQPFYRLGQLNGDPKKAHFLNKSYPGTPIVFRTNWRQGFFTRDLQVQILINATRSNALLNALSSVSAAALDATFTLEMPGRVIQHNGRLLNERTVTWTLDPGMPQTLEATARMVDVPLIVSLIFTLGSGGLASYTRVAQTGGRPGRQEGPRRPQLRSPRDRGCRPIPPPRPTRRPRSRR